MKYIVVDDNKLARKALLHLAEQVDFLQFQNEFDSAIGAFNYLQKSNVDLVFLDVEMPGMSGIELVKNLNSKPIVILITAKKEYAVEAFELNIADYILKPIVLPRFMAAVNKANHLFKSKDAHLKITADSIEFIFVKNKSVLEKIILDDILYIQALGDYVNIYTEEKRHTVHMTLSNLEQKLPADKFYRLHRSYIINIKQIDHIDGETVYINHHPVPVSEQQKQVLYNKINYI